MASTVMGTGAAPAAAGRTRPIALTPVLLLACAIAVAALGGCASAPQGEHMVGGHRKITQEELTQRLMAFADRYIARFSGGFDGVDFSRYSKVKNPGLKRYNFGFAQLLQYSMIPKIDAGCQEGNGDH